ncbi:MAG: hypothetical protein JJU34_06310 [Lunatimonas sp.]|uniref:hypothetical protein n=1 Tax=Lunatimonas sp. TaxID=2060141 RepID=UPI00263AEC84|nr:hypothetical protein [Lunatimonas sp.]MCC5936876.1 hypothetical protein [Lunatimonas sp.]
MKKYFKKPVLLLGSLAAVVGLTLSTNSNRSAIAQNDVPWCDWINNPNDPSQDGCKQPITTVSCICESGC